MKSSIRNVFAVLTILVGLAVVQAAWAETCNVTVSGEINAIDYDENAISVDDTTVYGIPLSYLSNQLQIVLEEGDSVVITANQCPDTGRLSACTLSINGGDPISLPGVE